MKVDTLVLGSGYAALGCACACEGALLLAQTQAIGEDYAGILRPVLRLSAPKCVEGQELMRFFEQRQVLDGTRLDALRAATVICRFAREKQLSVLLDAALIELQATAQGYAARCRTNSGVREIVARRVLDTTALRVSGRSAAEVLKKRLHVVCSGEREDAPVFEGADVRVERGFFAHEWTVSFDFSPETTLPQARLAVETRWLEAYGAGEYRIDAMGADFDPIAEPCGAALCDWLPPHAFNDPIAAFEQGAAWAREGR